MEIAYFVGGIADGHILEVPVRTPAYSITIPLCFERDEYERAKQLWPGDMPVFKFVDRVRIARWLIHPDIAIHISEEMLGISPLAALLGRTG